MFMEFSVGGMKIVNILMIRHVCKLFNTSAKWKYFCIYWAGYSLRNFRKEFASNNIPHCITMSSYYSHAVSDF